MSKKKFRISLAFAATALLLTACGTPGKPLDSHTEQASETVPEQTDTAKESNETDKEENETDQASSAPSLMNFKSETLEGDAIDQEVFAKAELTMLNIWATFCSPCVVEMPELAELNKEYADQGFQVVGIVADASDFDGNIYDAMVTEAKDIVEQTGADYTHILPSKDLMTAKLQYVSAVPETVFLDKDGNQVGESYMGARSKEDWVKIIDELLKEVQ